MIDEPAGPKSNGGAANRVAFDYIKSQYFRVIRADGAIGALTPHGQIHMALFSERQAIPRRLVHEVMPDGTLGSPIPGETVARDAVVREMDVDVFLSLDVARNLRKWLDDRINEAEARVVAQKDLSQEVKK